MQWSAVRMKGEQAKSVERQRSSSRVSALAAKQSTPPHATHHTRTHSDSYSRRGWRESAEQAAADEAARKEKSVSWTHPNVPYYANHHETSSHELGAGSPVCWSESPGLCFAPLLRSLFCLASLSAASQRQVAPSARLFLSPSTPSTTREHCTAQRDGHLLTQGTKAHTQAQSALSTQTQILPASIAHSTTQPTQNERTRRRTGRS